MTMTPADIENIYDTLAVTLDTIPEDKRSVFLGKLALLLAREISEPDKVLGLIADAAQDLDV